MLQHAQECTRVHKHAPLQQQYHKRGHTHPVGWWHLPTSALSNTTLLPTEGPSSLLIHDMPCSKRMRQHLYYTGVHSTPTRGPTRLVTGLRRLYLQQVKTFYNTGVDLFRRWCRPFPTGADLL